MTDQQATSKPREFPKDSPLRWETEYDDDDNQTYSASSFMCDGASFDDSTPFYWRISPVLHSDKIRYVVDGSDAELIGDDPPEHFDSADAAKAWCQGQENESWTSAVAKGEVQWRDDDDGWDDDEPDPATVSAVVGHPAYTMELSPLGGSMVGGLSDFLAAVEAGTVMEGFRVVEVNRVTGERKEVGR